jgi:creatinine amidohydrolase
VRLDQARGFQGLPAQLAAGQALLGVEGPIGFGWMSQDLHPAGVCGDAARADAGRGVRLLDHLGGRLAALLREVAEFPLDHLGEVPGRAPGRGT